MNGFKASLILVLAAGVLSGRAAVSETNIFANIRRLIPDGDSAGIEDVRAVASDIVNITSVQVRLKVAGNFNGDLYGFLSHGGGLTVLLNRPGRTATSPFGYDDCGFEVTFSDAAANDIHTYRLSTTPPAGSPLTGTWQPDARYTDPAAVLDTSLRSTYLSEFSGLNASGDWVLFLADMDAGGTNMLVSWELDLAGRALIKPALAWATPAAVSYGTALGAAQLSATAEVPGSFVYSPPAGTVLEAGNGWSLSVTFVPNDTNEYAVATAMVLLDVLPQALTVTADDQSRAYGGANPLLTGSLAGLQNGDNILASYTTPAAPDSPAGSYAIEPALSDPNGRLANYSVSTNQGTLQVVPVLLTVTADDLGRSYGAANPALAWQVSGFVNGETATAVLSGSPALGTLATPTSPVGDYPITPTPGSLSAANYTFAFVNGTLRVTPVELTGRADDQRRCYGETNPVFTATYRGFVNGEDASIVTGSLSGSSAAQTNSPVGLYPIEVWGQSAPNYRLEYEGGSLTVAPAPLVVQANDASRAYGQTNPTFTATLSGLVNNEDITALAGTLAFTTPAQTDSPAGSYPIEPWGLSATNYSLVFSNGALTVCPYALVVSADNQSRAYGTPNPSLTGSLAGVQNGDNLTASFSTLADESSLVGSYPIIVGLSDPDNKLPNYSVSTNQGTLSVAPAALVVSSDNQTRSYGSPNPGLTGSLAGVQNGDNLTASFSTLADESSAVGSYPITVGLSDPDNKLPNYSVSTNQGTLSVAPAALVVSTDNQTRSYGAPNPGLTGSLAGVQNGDNLTASFSTPAGAVSPVGDYPINIGLSDADNKLGNYSVTTNVGVLTVAPAELVGRADDQVRLYGQPNPLFTITYSGFVNGEDASVVSGALGAQTPAQTNSPVGVYPIQVWGQSAPNYHIQFVSGSLTVAPAPLVAQANDASRVWGLTNPVFSATFHGFSNGEGLEALSGTLVFSTPADTNSPVGSYPIEPSGLSATNYTLLYSNGTLRVCEFALVVSADNQARSYGAANPPWTGSLAGLQTGDNITANYATAADTNSPVGSYPITVSWEDPDNQLSKYSVTTNQGILTVTPAALLVSADNQSRSYGAPNPGLSGSLTGLQNGDNITASFATAADTNAPVGTYAIGPMLSDPDLKLGNYVVTTNQGILTVNPAALVVSADNQARAYGAPNPDLTGSMNGLQNGDNITPIYATVADATTLVGAYPISVGLSDPDSKLSNYIVSTNNGSLTVDPAPLAVSADNQARTYGALNPDLTGSISGLRNGDNITASFSTGADASSPVGDYPIIISLSDPDNKLGNYSVATQSGTLSVIPAVLTGRADDQFRLYGQSNPAFSVTYRGFVNGEDARIVSGALTVACLAQTNSPVGVYPIEAGGQSAPNYRIEYAPGNLAVGPVPLVVQANDASRAYGQTNPAFTVSTSGFVNGEDLSVLGGELVFTTPAQTNSPVGSYPIEPEGLSATNYSLLYSNGTLRITQYALAVTPDNQVRSYGTANPALTGTIAGLLEGDNITASFSTPADASSPVGDYPITASLSDPDGKLANYSVSTNVGTLTVAPAALVVAADDLVRSYGAPNPTLTGTLVSVQNGDNITASFSTPADATSPVGNYPIPVSLGDPEGKLSNYSVTINDGTLTVAPAALVVSADNQSRSYGSANPPLTGSISGLQNGESVTAGFWTEAGPGSAAGDYPIGISLLDSDNRLGNYNVTTNLAVLTVTPAELAGRADDQVRLYGQPNPLFTITYSGFVNGEDASVVSGTLGAQTPAQTNSPVGVYPIQVWGQSAPNYHIQFVSGSLTVAPAPLVVQADDASRAYGQTNPAFTATLSGLANDEDITALVGTLAFTTPAQTDSPVGSYPIEPSGLSATNYSLVFSNGTLNVREHALVVTADDLVRSYGATNPPLTGTVVGAQNGDNITANFSTPADASSPVGSYPIIASLSDPDGRLSNYSVTTNNGTLTVAPATLVVTADSLVRSYGLPNPVLTGTLVGLQNGDNITANFSTLADAGSPAAQYLITAGLSAADGQLGNYNVTTNSGTLTINTAATVGSIASSANPAPFHSWVTFTLRFDAAPPGNGTPTGTVELLLDEVPYGSPLTLSEGNANLSTDALPLGAHAISARYQGDENFLGVTVALASPQVIHTPPVAGAYTIRRAPNQGTRVSVSDLLAASSDPDGYALGLDSAASTTDQGGTVRSADGWLFYEPPAGLTNADSFTYTVRDQYGASAPGLVSIQVDDQAAPTLRPTGSSKGTNYFLLCGIPWRTYTIEYSSHLPHPTWQPLVTVMTDARGQFECADALPGGTPMRFYRCFWEASPGQNTVVVLLTSSCNPAWPGTAVTFTATVLAADPGLGIPSGSVQFTSETGPLGPAVALVEGVASLTTSSLASGLPRVAVEYGGDDHFLANAASLEPPQVVNTPPVASDDVVQRPPTAGTKVAASDLLANDSDPDGDPLLLDSVAPLSDEGGLLSLANGWIYYAPPAGFSGVDSFTYTVRDPYNATAVGTVTVEPLLSSGPSQSATFLDVGNGTYRIIFTGIPWRTYTIQYTEDPASANWLSLGTATADSWGSYQFEDTPPPGAPPRFYRGVSTFAGPTASPFRLAVWTNFIAHTNGRTMAIWSERSLPDGWPNVQPVLAWNTNCLLYGLDGFTAISQCNEFQGSPGQVPATLLTRRHAYLRGHGLGSTGLTTELAGQRVWFCAADNTVVTMTIAAKVVQLGTIAGQFYDYGLVVFTEDVPATLTPMSVLSAANFETYYSATPDLPFMFLGTEQDGYVSAQVPPFVYPLFGGGDSGSPNMIPTPDNVLVMVSGRSTSGPSPQMQADMDALSAYLGLNPNNYRLRWYNMRPWGP